MLSNRMLMFLGACLLSVVSILGANSLSKGELHPPRHYGELGYWPMDAVLRYHEKRLDRAKARFGSQDSSVVAERKQLEYYRQVHANLDKLLLSRDIDPKMFSSSPQARWVFSVVPLPNGMTAVVAGDSPALDVWIFNQNGERVHRTSLLPSPAAAQRSAGLNEMMDVAAFWFGINDDVNLWALAIPFSMGDPNARGWRSAVVYMKVITIADGTVARDQDFGEVARTEIDIAGLLGSYQNDSTAVEGPRYKLPRLQYEATESRALIGDTNGDDYNDIVIWQKEYEAIASDQGEQAVRARCIRLKQESLRVMLFSSEGLRFVESDATASLLPLKEGLWYDAARTHDAGTWAWPGRQTSAGLPGMYCDE